MNRSVGENLSSLCEKRLKSLLEYHFVCTVKEILLFIDTNRNITSIILKF